MVESMSEDGVLDMTGIGLVRGPEPERQVHRPIAPAVKKNTAPGAI
jgi:hypothetical protein